MKETMWTQATTNLSVALAALINCIGYEIDAWIEILDNTDKRVTNPVMASNPILDDPFQWTASIGYPRTNKPTRDNYINETEKDLVENWTQGFGDPKAVELYQKEGKITEGLMLSCGVAHPIRIKDAIQYRKEFVGDGYDNYSYWTYLWKPLKGIPYTVPDPSVGKVYCVFTSYKPANKIKSVQKTITFLQEYEKILSQ